MTWLIGGVSWLVAFWLFRVAQQNAALREAQVERWRAVLFDHGDAPRLIRLKGKVYKANGWPAYAAWLKTATLPLPARIRLRRATRGLGECHQMMLVEHVYQSWFVKHYVPAPRFRFFVARPDTSLRVHAEDVFGFLSAVLPPRVVNEELGDALEDIATRVAARRARIEIRVKIYSSVFWAVWHTVLYAVKGVTDALGRKGG